MERMEFHSASSPTLIIGNLAQDIDKNKLRRHFARFGIIVELTITKRTKDNQQQQKDETYALCHYAETSSAVRAYQQMDKKLLGNKRIMLGFHKLTPIEFIWVAGLDEEVTATDLFLQCTQFGSVERVTIDKFRELALVKFVRVDSAENAINELRGTILQGRRLQADFATIAWQTDFSELLDEQNADVETCVELDNEDATELNESLITTSNNSQSPVPETSSTNDDHNYTNAPKSHLDSVESEETIEYELLSIHDEEEIENHAESLNDVLDENDKRNQEQEQNVETNIDVVPLTSSPTVTTTNKDTVDNTNTNTKPTRKRRARKRNNTSIIDRNTTKYKCELCPAAFNGRAQLSNHVNYLHMGEPKNDVGTTPKTQTYSSTPVQHFCEWCPYWTYQKGSLNSHNQRVHLDLLPEQPKQPVREPFRRTVAVINELSSSSKVSKLEPCSCTMQPTTHFSDELIIYSPTSSPERSENSLIMTMSQPASPLSGTSSACFILVSEEDVHQQENDADVDADYGDCVEN